MEELSALLANSYALYLKIHNFHWNVTGPKRATLHPLFESQFTELALAVDEIADRIPSVGDSAPTTYSDFSALSRVEGESGQKSAEQMIRTLASDQETVAKVARRVMAASEAAGDEASAELAARRLDAHEKNAWALRGHIE